MKKRVLSLILALVMLIGVLPVNMLAAEPADELPAQQTVTIETSLDSALADGVYAAAQSPLPVSIRAEADGEAVEHTASLDSEALTGTQAADGWTAYELSFEAAGSYTLTVSAAGETQSRTIVYQPQSADEPAAEDPAEELPANDPELTPAEETPAEETPAEEIPAEEPKQAPKAVPQTAAQSSDSETAVDLGKVIGTVRVIVENNTADTGAADTGYGTWEAGAEKWHGKLVDKEVTLYENSTAMTCITDAVGDYSMTDSDGYITEIAGLKADPTSYSLGWMFTFNDWFPSHTPPAYRAGKELRDGDEICMKYTCKMGADIGSIANDKNKTLSSLTVTGAELNKVDSTHYEIPLGDEESKSVKIVPTAANKNFLACVFKGTLTDTQIDALNNDENSWYTNTALVRRSETVTVKEGDTFTVVVGAKSWPSQNNGTYGGAEKVDPGVYTVTAVKTVTDPDAAFKNFFAALAGTATVANDTKDIEKKIYPLEVAEDGTALVTTNKKIGKSKSGLTISFLKTAKLTFSYKTSSEAKWDYLKVYRITEAAGKETETLLNEADKEAFSGEMSDYASYSVEVQAGEKIRIRFEKDFSGDGTSDCVWLKNFTVTLPNKVIFHANNGTDATSEQGVFGTADLTKNTFTYAGYRFDGWAETAGGAVKYADGASITLNGADVNLYAVWTKVWTVMFPNMPKGAAITVKQGETVQPVSETANTWILPDGSYTYSAELFGYESKENVPFQVNGANLEIQDTLTAADKIAVTFYVTGAAADTAITITVWNSEKTVMTAREANPTVYDLPAGNYTYTVEAKGYKKIKNQLLTVGAAAQTVNVALTASDAWEGDSVVPTKVGDVYQITSGAELKGFADLVNGEEPGAKGILTKNITLNEPGDYAQKWTPMGASSSAAFTGDFDGNGKTITGLYMDGEDAISGLFGYVGKTGSIHDLTIADASVKSTKTSYGVYTALVAASNAGTISNVALKDSMVSSGGYAGGIAALNDGTITGCANESAPVTHNEKATSSYYALAGGIAGQNRGTIALSYNLARVTGGNENIGHIGGIAGKNESAGTIESCYNRGDIQTGAYLGGITGYLSGTATNCYSTGSVPTGTYAKALFGHCTSYSAKATACFYLTGCGPEDTKGTAKTAEEFKTLAASLGGAFADADPYPTLKWQDPNATFTITLTVKPANASVTVTGAASVGTPEVRTDSEKNEATYIYSGLNKGSYRWAVTCDDGENDYLKQEGSFTIATSDVTHAVTLAAKTYDVNFIVDPVGADFTLTQGEGEDAKTITPKTAKDDTGKIVYSLTKGSYHYTASCFGYADASGDVTVAKSTGLADTTVKLTAKTGSKLTFTNIPADAAVTVTHAAGGEQTGAREGETYTFTLVPETYSYRIQRKGYKSIRGTVTMDGTEKTIAAEWTALTAWDGSVAESFSGGSGTAADPYQIESGEELAYLSKLAADKKAVNDAYYVLTADIDLNNKPFTPIGVDSSHSFRGTFDGAGHVISNLKVEVTESAKFAGLFGHANVIAKDLTIDTASVTSVSINTGVLVGGLYSSGSATNCVVKNAAVTGTGTVGGLIGNCAAAVNRCAVMDTTVSGTSKIGGLIGMTGKTVNESYALHVTVTAAGDYAGGLVGGYCASTITSCFARGTVTGDGYVGGLIGDGVSSSSRAKIQNSYMVVDVTADTGTFGPIAGGSYASVTKAFYCEDSALTGKDSGKNTTGTPKTTAELKDAAILTRLGSAFGIYAGADGLKNAGFPYLLNAPALPVIQPQKLASPVITWTDKTASWTAVPNARGYLVSLAKGSETLLTETLIETTRNYTTEIELAGTGSYTITVTAIGDGETYGNSDPAENTVTITVNTASVTFAVTAEEGRAFAEDEPVITLTMADGKTTLPLTNNTAKTIPQGTYTYEVKAKTFATLTDTLNVTANQTVTLTMHYTTDWDGSTTVEPQKDGETYLISNSYELAWFRDEVNKGKYTLNARLTENINLGGHPWTAISKLTDTSAKTGYKGTFDGNGKTISGLNPVGELISGKYRGAGLFGYVYTGGTVKNVTVEGAMKAEWNCGGVVAYLAGGRVENCVNRMNITPRSESIYLYYVGGVVGYMTNYTDNSAVIIGCRNEGSIDGGTTGENVGGVVGGASNSPGISNCANTGNISGKASIGGIAATASIPITACYNTGKITGASSKIGGIVGYSSSKVTNCYNTGAVAGAGKAGYKGVPEGVGGIAGQLYNSSNGAVAACLNSGTVTSEIYGGALVGSKNAVAAAVSGSYALAGSCTATIGSYAADDDEASFISAEELGSKRLIGLLGGAFAAGSDGKLTLNWQDPAAKPVVTFVTPEGAAVTIEGQTPAEPGVFVLENGTYSYSVSKQGYNTATGSVTVNGESQRVDVNLGVETFSVTFNVTTPGAKITVTDAAGETIQPSAENANVYSLPNGEYHYIVSKLGCTSATGDFTVAGAAQTVGPIELAGAQLYTVTLTFTDDENASVTPASVTVKHADESVEPNAAGSFTYSLPDGTYTYIVDDARYYKVEATFTVSGKDATIAVQLETNKTWNGTDKTPVTPTDGVYEISTAAELAWFADQVNAGNTAYHARLTANIYVNYGQTSNTWTPIGDYSHMYTGTFDGNGKSVYGLTAALFGYTGESALVKNVTVYGSNHAADDKDTAPKGGISNQAYGSFEGCVSHMTISAKWSVVGGIVGRLYAAGHITDCANYGAISSNWTGADQNSPTYVAEVGGIAGSSSGPITRSFNAGAVTVAQKGYGGVGGIAGVLKSAAISDCYNTGTITGPSRTAGIVSIANDTASAIVKNCYNTGKIVSVSTSTNPACGTIAGTIANSKGDQIGSVENCYFLKGTYSYTSGSTVHTDEMVGYPLDKGEANCKLASEMKLDAFAITLSPTDKTFNVDAENNINGGFPVLKWQGGRAPQVTQDAEDVAADKAALTVTPTTVTSAGKLELASTGANGSAITWKSSKPAIIADDGTVTLPTNNDVTVILTATITKNGVSDMKEFTLTVRTAASADKAALEAIVAKLGTRFRVAYQTGDVNVLDTVRAKLADAITASGASLTADQITVTLADKGKTSLGAGTLIDDSGKVTYYYEDPSQSSIGTGDARVNGVTFTLSTANEVSVTTGSCMVSIPWDRAKVTEAMTTAAAALTFDTIKGENETSTAVTKTLTLPRTLESCGWSTISWTSSSVVVTVEDKGPLTPAEGTIHPNEEATAAKLTATFTFNKNIDDYNKDVEAPITVTRTIEVTIPGAASDYMQTIQKICAEYTLARLTDSVTKEPIDPANVTNDIQLLRSGDFTTVSFHTGSNGYAMTVTATAPDGSATTYAAVNGYRLKICRLAETAGQVKLTLTVTKKNGQTLDTRYTQTKELGTITVTPLKPSELAAELALLEQAKANFFAGINDDQNISADAVTKNLHAFHEARLDADGKLIWVYTSAETLGTGIVPTDLPGYDSMGTQPWRLFRSSNSAVIADENLLVTPHATDDKTVTITANLKSARFGGYYETCKDNSSYADVLDTLKKLAGEEVSVTVTVVSTANQAAAKAAGEKIDALFPVTKDSADAINEASGAYKSLTDAAKKLLPDAEEKLAKAEADYKKAVADAAQDQADRDAAAAVDAKIEAIGTVTLEKEGLITAARSAYEGLSDAAKEYVTKLGVLEAAEAKLNELKNAQGYQTQLQSVLAYIRSTVTPKANQSTNGDWAVMALARAGLSSDADKRWYAGYADELAKLLAANGGSFETTNENARLVLALTALGQNAKAYTVGGETYDLVTPLTAKTGSAYKATVPGTTSAAFAIIAIDSAPYTVADTAAVPAMIQYLLSMQNPSGAWKINNDNPADNVDATAMVLTALAPHKSETGVQDAIDKALTYLEGLTGYGNACTDAQLVTAYSALGIDCTDAKYARGGKNPLTSLLSYQTASGGFSLDSTASNARVSPRPTEQAAYALVAYDRFKRGVKSLYDMSDAVDLLPAASGAADVAAKITALGTVTDCKRETYLALQEIEAAYAGLTAEEQAEVTNYGTFLQRKQTFQTLLEAYRKAKLAELDAYYDKLKRTDYTTDQWTKITEAYRTGRSSISSAQYAEQADAALKQAKADIDAYVNGDTIEVSFRLIGDFPESYTGKHLGYVTWIETETYTVKKGSTVYDVFTEALQDAGLTSTGAASGYVRSITAPSILGGYTLSEFDNGAGSGWMFTVNGTHGNYALDEHVLQNGDRIVWHYVDNYATETSTWLTAADISPAEYARRHIGDVVTAGKHGKAAPVLTLSDLGRTVKFTFTPDKGCHVKNVKVNGKSIGAVESYTCSSLKIYDRITVEFTDGTLPFTDVRETDWFYDDVVFAYENGLFSGTTATTFSPYAPMTRAMLVTVLYRLEGEPAVTGRSGFSDVTIGSYYEAAVTWAADNGIVNGTSAVTFSPSENVTREQMAAILCRYAQYKQYGTSASAALSAFSDAAAVSTYAKAPLSWAVAEKLVNGTDGKLLPRASATRAQVAAILHRFVENITK